MADLLTASEMAALERAAMAAGAVTGRDLMERASRGVVAAILRWRPDLARTAHRATVLCGPGNNGGDGYAIARILRDRGWRVQVLGMGPASAMPPDARACRDLWEAAEPVAVLNLAALRAAPRADLLIDAVFGTGLSRPPAGDVADVLRDLAAPRGGADGADGAAPPLVAVDAPSGLDLDSGRALAPGAVPRAALTVTFEAPKIGHVLAEGPDRCGRLEVVDLGLAAWRAAVRSEAGSGRVHAVDRASAGGQTGPVWVPDFHKRPGHKYDHGHVVVVSGPSARTGAARLAARAALRVGAGLVTLASPPGALQENACHLTSIMLRRTDGAAGLRDLLADDRLGVACLGPGLGVGCETRALVAAALEGSGRRVVLDADALTSFADDPGALFALTRPAAGDGNPRTVLTPHDGEFRALFPDLHARRVAGPAAGGVSKVEATREAARVSGALVLSKGPDTVIAAPDGTALVHAAAYDRAVPWLATAGAGDVLAGMIAGLAGRMALLRASASAAWLHVECARAVGPGLVAEDLPEAVPGVLRGLDAVPATRGRV